MAVSGDGYILARTEAEYAQLRAQSALWQDATARILDRAGLARGMHCLDAGCGPGEVMRLMGRCVGKEGRVMGVDLDGALGEFAAARLREREGARFDFAAADIMGEAEIPGAPFDFVFARFLLGHMTDPVAALARLAGLVRTGGRLVVADYDMRTMGATPGDPQAARAFEIIAGTFAATGKRPDLGFLLPGLFHRAGLPEPEGVEIAGHHAAFRHTGMMARVVLASLRDAAISAGVASGDEIDAAGATLSRLEIEPGQWGMLPLLVGVWTRVGERDAEGAAPTV